MAQSNADRQRAYRARQSSSGVAEVRGIMADPDDHVAIKEAAAEIIRRRQRAAPHSDPATPSD